MSSDGNADRVANAEEPYASRLPESCVGPIENHATVPATDDQPSPPCAPRELALARETQLALALLDGAACLHQDRDRSQIGSQAVAAIERACPEAAAALFEWLDDAAVLALRAAGPRWRTAEREAPAWLAGQSGALAHLLQSTTTAAGQLPLMAHAGAAAHLVAVPLTPEASMAAVLVVAWPSHAEPAVGTGSMLERFARHVALALARGAAEQVGRAGTELQQGLEDAVRQQQLGLLGDLARGLVHDLNNALTTIVGTADWLVHALPDQSLTGDVERLRSAALDVAALVKRVRLLRSSGEAGREVVDLVQLAESAVDAVRRGTSGAQQTSASGHDFHVEATSCSRARVNMNEMRELLVNLLANSVEAMPGGGPIVVTVGGDEREAWIEVLDEGHGVPPAIGDRVFDPFVTSRDRRGAGLGLSVCWSIARSHGGRLSITSGAGGRGTRARLSLPGAAPRTRSARPALRESSLAPATQATGEGPLRILLVDDHEEVRRSVSEMLSFLGHTVTEAADADSALEAFSPDVDLVLTDWGMPGRSGTELAREMTARRPGMPVLLLTGWGTVLGSGAEPFVAAVLPKPVTLEMLRQAIETHTPRPHAGGEAA